MKSYEIVFAAILFLISIGAFVFGYFQFVEKGFLFNNAYLFASKTERAKMYKKPYYRQSAIVFVMIGVLYFLLALQMVVHERWISSAVIGTIIIILGYTIVSTIKIAKR